MKTARQRKIIELIEEKDIETQEELALLLKKSGFVTTQATISRDIRELRLIKVAAKGMDLLQDRSLHLRERLRHDPDD